jgi:hypothetical protein
MSTLRRPRRTLALAVTPLLAVAACSSGADDTEVADAPAVTAPSPVEGESDAAARGQAQPADSIAVDLMLGSVRAREVNLDDDREEFVEFCFTSPINEITSQGGFALAGLKPSNRVEGTEARLVENNDRCVLTSFPADTDVRSYTIGLVDNSVVEDRSGEVNIHDSVTLSGGQDTRGTGGTSAPELVSVSIDETLDQVSYVFDESELSEDGVQARSFGYYTNDGTLVNASSVESVDDDTVIVGFGEGGADQVDEAARFVVAEGAVKDGQGNSSTLGASARSETAVPDLVSVKRAAGNGSQYDFRFDEAVQREDVAKFILYTSDGQRVTASSVTRPSPEIVRATFSDASDFTDKIARAAVAADAVASLNSGAPGNTIGAASLSGGAEGGGPTSGPDLLGVTVDADTGEATFTFDATLEEDGVQPGSFFLVSDSGTVTAARDVVSVGTGDGVTGRSVVVLFDEADAQAAELGSVGVDAVSDQSGERNPQRTAALG